jgi:hypothetical protein
MQCECATSDNVSESCSGCKGHRCSGNLQHRLQPVFGGRPHDGSGDSSEIPQRGTYTRSIIPFHGNLLGRPSYKPGELRLLFLEPESNNWRILSNLYAKADFLIERDAIESLNVESLQALLERIPAPTTRRVLITRDMLK